MWSLRASVERVAVVRADSGFGPVSRVAAASGNEKAPDVRPVSALGPAI